MWNIIGQLTLFEKGFLLLIGFFVLAGSWQLLTSLFGGRSPKKSRSSKSKRPKRRGSRRQSPVKKKRLDDLEEYFEKCEKRGYVPSLTELAEKVDLSLEATRKYLKEIGITASSDKPQTTYSRN